MPAVKRDWERRMREIRTSGVMRGRGGLGRSSLLYRLCASHFWLRVPGVWLLHDATDLLGGLSAGLENLGFL